MKKISKCIVLLNLVVLLVPSVQAADEFAKVAAGAGVFYAGIFGLYYMLLTRISEIDEWQLQQNPDKYKVTDESLTRLIQQEAEKRGLDFSKFVLVKNMDPINHTMGIRSITGAKKYTLDVGSEESLKKFSEMDTVVQKAVVQHELNHVLYNHGTKRLCVRALSHYLGFLAGYAGLSLATHYTANYIEKNSTENSSIASWIHTVRSFMSVGFGCYAGYSLDKKCSPVFSRYCEKQADLAVDDDPEVVKGLITYCQTMPDRAVDELGKKLIERRQKFADQHPEKVFPDNFTDKVVINQLAKELVKQHSRLIFGEKHPTYLERIAYLKEKLQRCSNDETTES